MLQNLWNDPYTFWRWLKSANWSRAFLAGATLGLAELTKTTWIILFALWPGLYLVAEVVRLRCRARGIGRVASPSMHPVPFSRQSACALRGSHAVQLATIVGIALYLLNLGYGFEGSFQLLGKFQFISRTLGGADAHGKLGNRFAASWLGAIPVPVPANYVSGIDVQRCDFEKGKWSCLRGEQKFGGWWYYYLYAMLVKMPAGILCLLALNATSTAGRTIRGLLRRNAERGGGPSSVLDDALVLAPAVVLIALVSTQTGFNRYLRYVVPAFPFLYIWVGRLASPSDAVRKGGHAREQGATTTRWIRDRVSCFRRLVAGGLLGGVVSSAAVCPHNLSYFNEAAGGPLNGAAHLLDANIDWGQDLLWLKQWRDLHVEARPMNVAYFGGVQPRTANIDPDPQRPTPGERRGADWHAISVNRLYGYRHGGGERDDYAWARRAKPVARVGYSMLVFRSPTAKANDEATR